MKYLLQWLSVALPILIPTAMVASVLPQFFGTILCLCVASALGWGIDDMIRRFYETT